MKKALCLLLVALLIDTVTADKYEGDKKTENTSTGKAKSSLPASMAAGCAEPNGLSYIEFNNVRALIHTGGDMFWDFGTTLPRYEIPKGSGKHSMFLASLWLGGTDVNGQLRIAAQMYRSSGVDFWTGPLDTSGSASVSSETCAEYDKHFVINRAEVEQHDAAWDPITQTFAAGYEIPQSILDWPAHGDESKGQAYFLAPFYDSDGSGDYNPYQGDYPYYDLSGSEECNRSRNRDPKLFGDITYWWVFNDKGNVHSNTEGDAIGLEVRAQEFAFATNDEINNMTFTNYQIINRSTFTLIDTYFGTNFDPDLGFANDDYVGCDVKRGLGYCYNAYAIDGSGAPGHYGANPPAIGVDFFEGPFQDPDGTDNEAGLCDASINGLNFADGEIDNERWGMRRLVYYCNPSQPGCLDSDVRGDPETATDYYNYLKGIWKNGDQMVHGGTGAPSSCPGCTKTNFMLPGDSDPCYWGTGGTEPTVNANDWTDQNSGNPPADRRFVHSAGPFTLEPGAENDITVGIVWARATSSDPFQSVELLRQADDKAQALFDNCFKVLDGPDAPELTIQELDKELILYLTNPKNSNNYLEQYEQVDPLIAEPGVDNKYRFQGYQVFQLKDGTVAVSDLQDIEKARIIAQVDLQDSVTKMVNREFNQSVGAEIPTLMVNGENLGIRHSFQVLEDLFATGDKTLVNHKKYYFIAIAYAYNQYIIESGDPQNPLVGGNKKPYLAGRRDGYRKSITSVLAIPHIPEVEEYGTEVHSQYGDGPEIERIEGQGNGGKSIYLTSKSVNDILQSPNSKVERLVYQRRKGPIDVKVIDPLKIKGGSYVVKFFHDKIKSLQVTGVTLQNKFVSGRNYFLVDADVSEILNVGDKITVGSSTGNDGIYTVFDIDSIDNGIFVEEHIPSDIADGYIESYYKWVLLNGANDTVFVSEASVNQPYETIFPDLGISITTSNCIDPGPAYCIPDNLASPMLTPITVGALNPHPNNGFLEASMTFANGKAWLSGIVDSDAPNGMNWIRSGVASDSGAYTDCILLWDTDKKEWYCSYLLDEKEAFEKVLGGTWAPYRLASYDSLGPAEAYKNNDRNDLGNLAGVDIVITPDRSKWTRAVVLELQENPQFARPLGSSTEKLRPRADMSVDKDGKSATDGSSSSNYDGFETGMGWFPGYAINVETGERLNIMFGEDSWQINGGDMLWNPTSDLTSHTGQLAIDNGLGQPGDPGIPFWAGGKHCIYIVGHNGDDTSNIELGRGDVPAYDEGAYIRRVLDGNPSDIRRMGVFKDVMWVGMPLLEKGFAFDHPDDIPSEVTIGLRVNKPFKQHFSTPDSNAAQAQNGNHPMYGFNLDEFAVRTSINDVAVDALDDINIVPNPYFAFSGYETTQLDHRVKIINLPVECSVSIYSINGTLIRSFERDDRSITSIDWDLKNFNSVPIASGVYLIHVTAPGIGERVIKWFGSLRPVDLDSF